MGLWLRVKTQSVYISFFMDLQEATQQMDETKARDYCSGYLSSTDWSNQCVNLLHLNNSYNVELCVQDLMVCFLPLLNALLINHKIKSN